MELTIYHNPRCRKSRETLELLEKKGANVKIVQYLTDTPTEKELASILQKLHMQAEDLIRKGESIFKDNYKGKSFTNEEWIKIMVENPKLIERPIVVKNNKAVIGRPPENVLDLL
jgi:arsenate reductase